MKEWLPMLNVRSKWTTTKRNLEIGDVVLAISPEQPRGHLHVHDVLFNKRAKLFYQA